MDPNTELSVYLRSETSGAQGKDAAEDLEDIFCKLFQVSPAPPPHPPQLSRIVNTSPCASFFQIDLSQYF
jgi:hypothetical protein